MRILFVHQGLASFVQRDLDLLRFGHEVRAIQFTGRKGLARSLCIDLWRLWRGVWWCELSFSWFGKLHALFAVLFSKLLGKKAVVVAGGDDVERGEIGGRPYGLTSTIPGRMAGRIIFGLSDLVLSVSHFNRDQALTNVRIDPGRIVVIYHGFDSNTFRKLPEVRKERLVLTVGQLTAENYHRKGLKIFLEAARHLPDVSFCLAGTPLDGTVDLLKRESPSNVTITGDLSLKELAALMGKAAVYVQASEIESFGCSLAEAMLCECVPVVFRGTALPEVVGECGYYIERLDARELAAAIREALRDERTGRRARERIASVFPLEKRREALLDAVESVAQPGDAKVVRA